MKNNIRITTYVICLIFSIILVYQTGSFWISFISSLIIWAALYYTSYFLLTTKEERIADKKKELREREKRDAEKNRINSMHKQTYSENDEEDEGAEEIDMDNQYYSSNHDPGETNPWNP